MFEMIDHYLFHLANGLVATSAGTFYEALEWSDKPSWFIAAAAIIAMWFYGSKEEGGKGISLQESRRRVILIFAALVMGFVSARLCQLPFDRLRPIAEMQMQVPIDANVWQMIKDALSMQGSFPSDHGVLFAVMTIAAFMINVRLGIIALILNIAFSIMRVGVGFHYPSDILGGEVLGALYLTLLIRFGGIFRKYLDMMLALAERFSYIFYPLAFLFMVDFTAKFTWLFTFLHEFLGSMLDH